MPKNTQKLAKNSLISPGTTNKTNLHLNPDLVQCLVYLNKRPVKAIRDHL